MVGYLSPSLNIKIFDTHVLPILEYNSEIWFSGKEIDNLEKQFLKNMLGQRLPVMVATSSLNPTTKAQKL